MNLNCCIVEDEKIYSEELYTLLVNWSNQSDCPVTVASAVCDRELLALPFLQYDIIFIDIMLKNSLTGIEIAQTLRDKNYTGEIVFLTSFCEYVFEGYPVNAMDYLLKPVSSEKISRCMDRLAQKLLDRYFIFRQKSGILQIPYQNILYFSSENHNTNVITLHDSQQLAQSLRKILKILPGQFSQCHRTLIVNRNHIIRMDCQELTLTNGEYLPIGKSHLRGLQQDILRQMRS